MIYFDQAATSFPKPKEVIDAMLHMMNDIGASPGRSGHKLEREAANIVKNTRLKLAQLFGCSNPNKAIFMQNATIALNQAIKGLDWKEGDHIVATSLEHNSVRRPLEYIKEKYDVKITYLDYNNQLVEEFKKSILPSTKVAVFTHACNVTGQVVPLRMLTSIAKENNIITIVDSSQTAGHLPIHMEKDHIDMMAFPGHKGLLGPQGIGMLLVNKEINLTPIHHGGTGVHSENHKQPNVWPSGFESGTLNTPGIAGFHAALKLFESNYEENVSRETFLVKKLVEGLKEYEQVRIYSPTGENILIPIVAFNIEDIPSQEIAIVLDSYYDIAVRAGLHCNPLSHQTHNTLDQGMVRVSLNSSNTEEEVDRFIKAINEIITGYQM